MGLIRNTWYVAAERSELGDGPLARTIVGDPVVLFRTQSGMPVALRDRCPHRFLPLSKGRVEGEEIRCLYHGAQFNAAGTCVGVPGLRQGPKGLTVKSYPVVEKFGWIWIWMGDSTQADPSRIPTNVWYGDDADPLWKSNWNCFSSLAVDYRLINDNLMDITHAQYVHPESFGFPLAELARKMRRADGPAYNQVTYKIDEGRPRATLWFSTTGKLTPYFYEALSRARGEVIEGDLDFVMEVEWVAPGSVSFLLKFAPAGRLTAGALSLTYLHLVTPELQHTTHYFFKACHDSGRADLTPWVAEGAKYIFGQDKVVLEAQQQALGDADLFAGPDKPALLPGDTLSTRLRELLKGMQAAESEVMACT